MQDEYSTPIPQGATTAPASSDEYSTPIPQGAQLGSQSSGVEAERAANDARPWWRKVLGIAPADYQPSPELQQRMEQALKEDYQAKADPVIGIAKGAGQTAVDADNLVRKGLNKVGGDYEMLGTPSMTDLITGHDPLEVLKPKGEGQMIGYGGENLLEFLAGDEALKGLSWAEKLSHSAKVAKLLESSPRLLKAVKMGASAGKATAQLSAEERKIVQASPVLTRLVGTAMDATRAGFVQGGQTFVKSGGDAGESLKDAATMGVTSGVIGGVTGVAGHLLSKAGNTAEKVQQLSEIAENAASKEEVAQKIGKNIDTAEQALHDKYQVGIDDLKDRLGGNKLTYEGSPIHKAAVDLTEKGAAEAKPLDEAFSQARPGSKRVNDMVDSLANPGKESEAAATDKWVDTDGVERAGTEAEATKPAVEMDINELVERRQLLGQRMRKLGWATTEDRADREVYRKLINGIDDSIGNLADKSGDATAVSDYKALRANYGNKINLFNDPVITKLREGKVDDAAKAFVGLQRADSALPSAGKVRYNTEVLRGILGDAGVKDFGHDVFGTMLKDSIENGRFNPAKFAKTWSRIAEETKTDVFDTKAASSALAQLAQDAKSGAAFQHLARVGVLTSSGAALGTFGHAGWGAAIGLLISEGGGRVEFGRKMLDYVANHPAIWGAYKALGKAANSAVAKGVSKTAQIGAGKGGIALRQALSGADGLRTPD